jgi:hypothetical protein
MKVCAECFSGVVSEYWPGEVVGRKSVLRVGSVWRAARGEVGRPRGEYGGGAAMIDVGSRAWFEVVLVQYTVVESVCAFSFNGTQREVGCKGMSILVLLEVEEKANVHMPPAALGIYKGFTAHGCTDPTP